MKAPPHPCADRLDYIIIIIVHWLHLFLYEILEFVTVLSPYSVEAR